MRVDKSKKSINEEGGFLRGGFKNNKRISSFIREVRVYVFSCYYTHEVLELNSGLKYIPRTSEGIFTNKVFKMVTS